LIGFADQQTALVGPHGHQADPVFGKAEHLQGFGKLDQAPDVVGDDLLRTESEVDREIFFRQQRRIFEKIP
jgi:hypothetical protein